MTKLSVNINKIATLRNSRGGNNPNLLAAALACERFGAQGITVHPRPDERHIRYQDVFDLKAEIQTELNIDEPISGETELFSSGMLDSVSMIGLIAFVEQKTGMQVQPGDVTLDNFDSIDAILGYVAGLG